MVWLKNNKQDRQRNISTIINHLRDGILVFDKNNKLSLINPQAEEFLEIKNKEVLGLPISRLSHFTNFQHLVFLLGAEIKEIFRKQVRIRENLILEISTISILTENQTRDILVILHDITKEKLVEKMKTEFVTLAAHQLRNPLSSLKWTIKMMLDGTFGEITKEQRTVIEKAYKSNEKMIRLVNSLLNVAQIEEGKYLSNLVLSDFEKIITSVLKNYKELADEKKLKVEFQKPSRKLPKVMLDKEKMTIALSNIIDNALRYSTKGGKVLISVEAKQKEIRFQIKDNGLGIPKNQQVKVFTKFFRATNVLKVDIKGIGLGLYIAKNIIEAHGGSIGFESKGTGRGSTFSFVIPIKEKFGEFIGREFY